MKSKKDTSWLPEYARKDIEQILIYKDNKRILYNYLWANYYERFVGLVPKGLIKKDCSDWTDSIYSAGNGFSYKTDISLSLLRVIGYWSAWIINKNINDLMIIAGGFKGTHLTVNNKKNEK